MSCGVAVRVAHASALAAIALAATSCQRESDDSPPPVRIVRTITVEPRPETVEIGFTGHIEPQDQASLAFRIGGRLAERRVGIGTTLREGETVARLDPEDELNDLRSAKAALTAAQSDLRKAENQFERQSHLLDRNITTRADFEVAEQARTAARAQVDAARARVQTAEDIVGFTVLKADAPGVVTRTGAEPAEVVRAGQMVVQLARRDGRDAVFEFPADLTSRISADASMIVALASDPAVAVTGRVREVAPQADPLTRTFRVRVGLTDPPPTFRLGTTVTGSIRGGGSTAVAIPVTALNPHEGTMAAWVVNPETLAVSRRKLDVQSTNPATALVAHGLDLGDVVVVAGTSLLREGQQVRLAGAEAP